MLDGRRKTKRRESGIEKIKCVNGKRSTVNGMNLKSRRQEAGNRRLEGQKSRET
jgi:hypothetical protein